MSALWFHADLVLLARDALLDAGVKIISYDLYPGKSGRVLVSAAERENAIRALSSRGVQFKIDSAGSRSNS